MQNLRGAYLILVAIKQDGKSIKVSTPKGKYKQKLPVTHGHFDTTQI